MIEPDANPLPQQPPVETLPFERLGHYQIVGRIGSGGMGDVFKGYDVSLDRFVAIKVLAAELARDDDFVHRFRIEATAVAKLTHPNVVRIDFIGQDAGHHFFAMQFIEGESLGQQLARQRQVPMEQATAIIEQCLAGLGAAHAQGLVHRDVKPGNVLLDRRSGQAVLVDFGLVRRMGESSASTASGAVMGTVDYIAPEQVRGLKIDGRSDIYSLGAMYYQMLAGRLPYQADTPTAMVFQDAHEGPFPLAQAAPGVPQALVWIIARMMAKDPAERYGSCADVLADLRTFREGQPRSAPPAPAMPAPVAESSDADSVRSMSRGTAAASQKVDPVRSLHLQPEMAWQRAKDWLATVFRRHAPDALKELRSTTQQIDSAVAEHERRLKRLTGLLDAARNVVADLAGQIEATEKADLELDAQALTVDQPEAILQELHRCREDLAALRARYGEQQEQVGRLEIDVAKGEATLVRLESQRDLLNARMKAVEARQRAAGTAPSRRTRFRWSRKSLLAVAGIAAMVLGTFSLWLSAKFRVPAPAVSPSTAEPVHEVLVPDVPPRAVAPFDAKKAKEDQEACAKRLGVPVEITNSIGMKLVLIPSGEFEMGSSKELIEEELRLHGRDDLYKNRLPGEAPLHRVRITKPFYLGKYLVTQEQWEAVMGYNVSAFKAPKNPVNRVNWDDCQAFLLKLTAKTGGQGGKFVLPTEAQWEYACRAGSTGKFCFGDDERRLGDYAWYLNNADRKSHPVGEKKPNAWGLYDMHGNLWEWCGDWYDGDYYAKSPADDPTGPVTGSERVIRGGCWSGDAVFCRSADRDRAPRVRSISLGFRVAQVPADVAAEKSPIPTKEVKPTTVVAEVSKAIVAPASERDKVVCPLNGAVADIVVGGGGRYLISRLADKQQLAVFDVPLAKVVKQIPLAEQNAFIAAGAERLVVIYPDTKLLRFWNLSTLERGRSILLPENLASRTIHQVCMGSASSGPLFVYLPAEKRTLALDIDSLTTTQVNWSQWSPTNAYGPLQMRAAPDGSVLIGWGGGWAGCELAFFDHGRQTGSNPNVGFWAYNGSFALPSADGRFIYSPSGVVIRALTVTKVSGIRDAYVVPAAEPGYFVALANIGAYDKVSDRLETGQVGVYNDDRRLLFTLSGLEELKTGSRLPWEKRIHYYPRAGVLVTLGAEQDRLILRRVALLDELEKSGADYLLVLSRPPTAKAGAFFSYMLDVHSKKGGVKVSLDSGPDRLSVTPEGQVRWNVPANFEVPEANVVVRIHDASGQEIFHTFPVKVTGGHGIGVSQAPVGTAAAQPVPQAANPSPRKPSPEETSAVDKPPAVTTLALPRAYNEVRCGAGGRYLIFHTNGERKLTIVDVVAGKIVRELPLPSERPLFAAGREKMMIAYPELGVVQRWDLKTLEREKTALLSAGPIAGVLMGCDSLGPLLIWPYGTGIFWDCQTMRPMKIDGPMIGNNAQFPHAVRVSADGRFFTEWTAGLTGQQFHLLQVEGNRTSCTTSPDAYSVAGWYAQPNADGSLLIHDRGFIQNAEFKSVPCAALEGAWLTPSADPRFFFAAGNSEIWFCTAADCRIIYRLRVAERISVECNDAPRIYYLDHDKIIATLPDSNDKVIIRHFDLRQAIDGLGLDYLLVVSKSPARVDAGSDYRYVPEAWSKKGGVKYRLDEGPPGMTVSPTGEVRWQVKEPASGDAVRASIFVCDASNTEVFHNIELFVHRREPAAPVAAESPGPQPSTSPQRPPSPSPGQNSAVDAQAFAQINPQKVRIPGDAFFWTSGLGNRTLGLSGDRLVILGSDGISIQSQTKLPREYTHIAERREHYVALASGAPDLDTIDNWNFRVIRSIHLPCKACTDLALHPTLPVSYIATKAPWPHFVLCNERTREGLQSEEFAGAWLKVDPNGKFLIAEDDGSMQPGPAPSAAANPAIASRATGRTSRLIRYSLSDTGEPGEKIVVNDVGGGGQGLRMSPDGARVTCLGGAVGSTELKSWDTANLNKPPVKYTLKDRGTPTELAYHPSLPLVAMPGGGLAVLFHRETGAVENDRLQLPGKALDGAVVDAMRFSPDGRNLIFLTTVGKERYLYSLPLEFSAEELDRVDAAAEVGRCDGNVTFDENSPTMPVIGIRLRRLHVSGAEMEHFKCLTELRVLDLDDAAVTDGGLVHLKGLTKLQTLSLSCTGFGHRPLADAGLMHLKALTALRTLNLSCTNVTDAGLEDLQGLTNLRTLGLSDTRVTGIGLKYLSRLADLQSLSLAKSPVTDAGLEHLKTFPKLRSLDLNALVVHKEDLVGSKSYVLGRGDPGFWRAGITDSALEHLGGLTNLETLDLFNTRITDAGLKWLEGMSKLRSLSLGQTAVTDVGFKHLESLTDLEALDLWRTRVNGAGLEHIKGSTNLRKLDLAFTQVTDAGLTHLERLAHLESLDLTSTPITDAGLEHLRGLRALRSLSMPGVHVTDTGLKYLYGLTNLEKLDLTVTWASSDGVKKLQHALPKCAIRFTPRRGTR